MPDKFVVVAPRRGRQTERSPLVRIPADVYAQLAQVSEKTGITLCKLAGMAIDYALERIEVVEEGEPQ